MVHSLSNNYQKLLESHIYYFMLEVGWCTCEVVQHNVCVVSVNMYMLFYCKKCAIFSVNFTVMLS